VARTGSTNADLAVAAGDGEPAGLVLVAGEQTAGRGRLGRTWSAPAGTALTFSVLLRPPVAANRLGWLPLVTGLAVVEAIRGACGDAVHPIAVDLKWPNDVLVEGRKLGGILSERVGGTDAVVVGVGVNVTMTADQLPVPTATSLAVALSPVLPPTVDAILDAVLARLDARYSTWEAGTDPLEEYRAACSTLGRAVRVDLPAGAQLSGTARDVDVEGRLLVETASGVQAVAAGDVEHVR